MSSGKAHGKTRRMLAHQSAPSRKQYMQRIYLTLAALLLADIYQPAFPAAVVVNTCQTIDQKYQSLGGMAGPLGAPVSDERVTPLGDGRYRQYQWGTSFGLRKPA